MKPGALNQHPIGEKELQVVIHQKLNLMTNPTLRLPALSRKNSYVRHFEYALHNLQLWQAEQRERRIERHRKKQSQ
jgi:hypothetical protein